ncbi:hem peroxidase [Arabidopsis suecica]|uniref:peroxidase n=1 Tax=Arabidopsis suecica TaxID=45249 RepID=A0A8T1XZW2_ARASU|nr:hem peroxidase [Arabidopsis suecica]
MVALSGAHTIGRAQCVTFRNCIYNESNIDTSSAILRRKSCPAANGSKGNKEANLDDRTPYRFDHSYFMQFVNHRGLLTSDQVLFNGGSTYSIVISYNWSVQAFYRDFVTAMIKNARHQPTHRIQWADPAPLSQAQQLKESKRVCRVDKDIPIIGFA